ncbi:MAG: hypothetical protein ACAH59_09900, partial [Pseudobdellovibrionaceae bacterium]
MNSKKGFGLLLASGLAIAACATFKSETAKREIASKESWAPTSAQKLDSGKIEELSSGGKMKLKTAHLIIDNDRAFQKKLEMVRSAQKNLRLVYYIWSDDYSSSLFNAEVIAAARRGVQVQILVDFITNYERLDLFSYLESAGQGNIKVKFYGLPPEEIQRAAVYMTIPCSKVDKPAADQCKNEKLALLSQMGNPKQTWFSQMFLSGMYGRNAALISLATKIGGGFDPAAYKQGPPPSPQKLAQLKQFAKIVFQAAVKNDAAAKLKMQLALTNYGDDLNPIMNELTGRLPFAMGGGDEWDHLTDYTHHKLLA